jgi:hypothetical protein
MENDSPLSTWDECITHIKSFSVLVQCSSKGPDPEEPVPLLLSALCRINLVLHRHTPLSVVKQGYYILEDDPVLHALLACPVQNCMRSRLPTQKTLSSSLCFLEKCAARLQDLGESRERNNAAR